MKDGNYGSTDNIYGNSHNVNIVLFFRFFSPLSPPEELSQLEYLIRCQRKEEFPLYMGCLSQKARVWIKVEAG